MLLKFKITLYAFFMYAALMLSMSFCYMHFFNVNVVFYSSLLSSLIAAVISAYLLFKLPLFNKLESFEKSLLAIIFILVGYCFSINIPTIIDRSFTLYMLEQLRRNNGGIAATQFEKELTKKYIEDYQLVPLRITEQLESGTIYIDLNNCIKLTRLGKVISSAAFQYRLTFLPRSRLINGVYTDKLVTLPSENNRQSNCSNN